MRPTSIEAYLAGRTPSGDYADGYYSHNLHFLWAVAHDGGA